MGLSMDSVKKSIKRLKCTKRGRLEGTVLGCNECGEFVASEIPKLNNRITYPKYL